MAKGESYLSNLCFSDDVKIALNIAKSLGAEIIINNNTAKINGNFKLKNNNIFVGEAGLSTRMFIPITSLLGSSFSVNGQGTILKRPMNTLIESLQKFGLTITSNKGFLPFTINGKLESKNISIDASKTSQALTGFLMALPLTNKTTTLEVPNLKSKPYIDLTLDTMKSFGVNVINNNYKYFTIPTSDYQPTKTKLEGDWSSAAFWFVAAAINGNLKIHELNSTSKQADMAILDAIKLAGVNFSHQQNYYSIKKSVIKAFKFDSTDSPDLFPALAVLAANAQGISEISGVHRLVHKESNRAEAIVCEFNKQGIKTNIIDDKLVIKGTKNIKGGKFNSYKDHRMAMAGAILALKSKSEIEISNYQSVSKSYPNFFNDFEKLIKNNY